MTSPSDESRTELAWREIVENYGDRPTLDGSEAPPKALEAVTDDSTTDLDLEDDLIDEPEDEVATVDRFQPPIAPPVPLPRTWQRGVAWGGIFIAPTLAILITLLGLHPPRLIGWGLVIWLVGGFVYLVADMPDTPREPWDNGSRV